MNFLIGRDHSTFRESREERRSWARHHCSFFSPGSISEPGPNLGTVVEEAEEVGLSPGGGIGRVEGTKKESDEAKLKYVNH